MTQTIGYATDPDTLTPVMIMAKTILKGRAVEAGSKRIAQNVEDDLKAAGFVIVPANGENAR